MVGAAGVRLTPLQQRALGHGVAEDLAQHVYTTRLLGSDPLLVRQRPQRGRVHGRHLPKREVTAAGMAQALVAWPRRAPRRGT
jgi:hypothetical protein